MVDAQVERWIIGRRTDMVIYFGGPVAALLVGALVVAAPQLLAPLFIAWLLLIDGPHLLITYLRVAHAGAQDPDYRTALRRSWLCFAPPLVLWMAAVAAGLPGLMEIVLSAGVILSWYHLARQHHGILVIYQAQTAIKAAGPLISIQHRERRYLRAWLWSIFLLSAFVIPANRERLGAAPVAAFWWDALALALALFCAGVALCFLWLGAQRHRSGEPLRPWWFAFAVALCSGVGLLWVGSFEPIQPGARGAEQMFMAVTLITGMVHGIQYLGIVFITNARRGVSTVSTMAHTGLTARLARAPALVFLALLAASAIYVALYGATGALPGLDWPRADSAPAQFALALYWGLFFQHYYVDSKIWRVGKNAALRTELGLAPMAGARA